MPTKSKRATPAVVKLATAKGIDLANVKGTGAGGRITTTDVRAAHIVRLSKVEAAIDSLAAAKDAEMQRLATTWF